MDGVFWNNMQDYFSLFPKHTEITLFDMVSYPVKFHADHSQVLLLSCTVN